MPKLLRFPHGSPFRIQWTVTSCFFYDIALAERAASHFSTGIACRLNFIGAKSPCFAGGRGVKYPMQAQQRNDALSRD